MVTVAERRTPEKRLADDIDRYLDRNAAHMASGEVGVLLDATDLLRGTYYDPPETPQKAD